MKLFKPLNKEEEDSYRTWARAHYKPLSPIKGVWHPVVQDECVQINRRHQDNGTATED